MATQSATNDSNDTAAPKGTEVAIPAPVLLIAARSFAKVTPIVLAFFVFGFALAHGTDPTTAGIRALVALAATGLVGWIIVSLLAQIILWVVGGSKPQAAAAPATSTQSWEA